ncbi:MAG: DUF1553 domain-containing protein [Pirellulales bacterium]
MLIYRQFLHVVTAVVLIASPAAAADPGPAALDLFEKKIRPVLVAKCYECHSAAAEKDGKLKGAFKLDSAAGLRRGGETGPALVSGKPDDSLLIEALKHEGLEMPPSGKLPAAVIADFERWIAAGAPDPRTEESAAAAPRVIDIAAGRRHWAYQLPQRPALPAVAGATSATSAIDRFILNRLEKRNLAQAPVASREVLARRLYFDLIGLPPSPEEIDAFVADRSPDAAQRLIDRLLASPHFGERWGRHWLDVARFAESLTLRGFILTDAWRYRDYVIDSFNEDVPYTQFVAEQVAGDLLPAGSLADARRQRVATALLALGNTNLEEQDKKQLEMDVIDEQLETIGRAFLAQTIGCARCHDHKFDPIPTSDYYALAGILRGAQTLEHANVSKWLDIPLPISAENESQFARHKETVEKLQTRIEKVKTQLAAAGRTSPKAARPVRVADLAGVVVDDPQAKRVGQWQASTSSKGYVGDGYLHDQDAQKGEKTLTFAPELPHAGQYEVRIAYTAGDNRAAAAPVTIFSADGETTVYVDQQTPPPVDGHFFPLGRFKFEKNGQGFVLVSNEGTRGHVIADAVQFLPVDELQKAATDSKPADRDTPSTELAASELRQLQTQLKELTDSAPTREVVPSVRELKQPANVRIHVRGSVHNLGPEAPRGFLQVATYGSAPSLPNDESGRRQLAEWLTSAHNPLTARVIANRVWHWLWGAGLVRTTDNLGTTGELPSDQELLDYLAVSLLDDGWSIKRLVRRIVSSRAYQAACQTDGSLAAADPENRLFGRANRRRLEAECLRDALLASAGELSLERTGRTYPENLTADYSYQDAGRRRSVYVPVFRNALPDVFLAFDFADPSVSTGVRNTTTHAPQALFMLNHPDIKRLAATAAKRLLRENHADDAARIRAAYRRVLGRAETPTEQATLIRFLQSANSGAPEALWTDLLHALFASLDFRYVD